MFAYMYEPRISSSYYPRTRNYPCSYYHNHNPFYNQPEPFYYSTPRNYFSYDEEDQRKQLLREQLLREQLLKEQLLKEQLLKEQLLREQLLREQQEYERERELERLKRFYGHKERQQKQPEATESFKVKIQSDEDEAKAKINKSRAAHKIYNFIKNQSANKQTRKILNKLYSLHKIENELKKIQETKYLKGNLTFNKENGKQILPISIENKTFLEYEDKIVKTFDKLDGIQSEGANIIRDRRKFLVKFAQTLLDELDIEKENQWKVFSENQLNSNEESDVPVSDNSTTIVEKTDVPISSENEGNVITKDEDSVPVVDVPMSLENEGNENIVNNHNSIEPIVTTISKESEPENIEKNLNENVDTESFDQDGDLQII